MKKSAIFATPAVLVAVALPVLFFLAPDGIPCVYAGCGTRTSPAVSPTVLVCQNCAADQGENESITVAQCSATASSVRCELSVSLAVTIGGTTACDLGRWKYCKTGLNINECAPTGGTKVVDGPHTEVTLSASNNCDAEGDQIIIEFAGAEAGECGGACDACACTPKTVFSGKAFCYHS